ncbi:hypothetical protein BD626DRAFT_571605 [Schizophyllum amplum]|uniref:Paired amphipathic helix n=1 Tax=Schizophyllum amplum TaxID=97359 RepID=A0A550C6W3_9AGAR|nr:hypothetical protein BD626DRAFT_571605 [Auriculariopsis ampla]
MNYQQTGRAHALCSVAHALSYLEAVRATFADNRPDVYNRFLVIMAEHRNQTVDTTSAVMRVVQLFNGYPVLIRGFIEFLPPGYRIEFSAGYGVTVSIFAGSIVSTDGTRTHIEPMRAARPLPRRRRVHQP